MPIVPWRWLPLASESQKGGTHRASVLSMHVLQEQPCAKERDTLSTRQKMLRERTFPIDIIDAGLQVRVQDGQASQDRLGGSVAGGGGAQRAGLARPPPVGVFLAVAQCRCAGGRAAVSPAASLPNRPKSPATSTEIGRSRGRRRPNSTQFGPEPVKLGPNSIKVGPESAKLGPSSAKFGPHEHFGPREFYSRLFLNPDLDKFGPKLSKLGPDQTRLP